MSHKPVYIDAEITKDKDRHDATGMTAHTCDRQVLGLTRPVMSVSNSCAVDCRRSDFSMMTFATATRSNLNMTASMDRISVIRREAELGSRDKIPAWYPAHPDDQSIRYSMVIKRPDCQHVGKSPHSIIAIRGIPTGPRHTAAVRCRILIRTVSPRPCCTLQEWWLRRMQSRGRFSPTPPPSCVQIACCGDLLTGHSCLPQRRTKGANPDIRRAH